MYLEKPILNVPICMWMISAFLCSATWGCTLIYINYSEFSSFFLICSRKVETSKKEEQEIVKNGTCYEVNENTYYL